MHAANPDSAPLPWRLKRLRDIGGSEPDEKKVVWRYVSLGKLIWTIQKQQLFFSSMDELQKGDPYEGLVPTSLRAHYDQWGTQTKLNGEIVTTGSIQAEKMAKRLFVNCWHLNPTESVAMWKLYSDRNGAVLRSTVARLDESVTPPGGGDLFIVPVTYIGYESRDNTDKEPGLELAMLNFKDESLDHEKEVRLVFDPQGFPARPSVHINLSTLAESILLSPIADAWLVDCVNELLRQNSLPPICRKSELRTWGL